MRLRVLAGGAVLLVLPLAGCGETSVICVDFVDFESPAAAAADAALVIVGTVQFQSGERTLYGEPAPIHRVAVESVLKGELPSGTREIEVASIPQTCNGEERGPFPDGDPLDTDQRVELFLFIDNGEYRTVTPWDGVEPAPAGKPLPWDPAAADPAVEAEG